jgi:hypothetical protein
MIIFLPSCGNAQIWPFKSSIPWHFVFFKKVIFWALIFVLFMWPKNLPGGLANSDRRREYVSASVHSW